MKPVAGAAAPAGAGGATGGDVAPGFGWGPLSPEGLLRRAKARVFVSGEVRSLIPCTLHPCTLHPTPYTLHLPPYTLYPPP